MEARRLIVYLEGQGDLVSRLTMGIIGVTIWVLGLLTYLLSPPDPPSRVRADLLTWGGLGKQSSCEKMMIYDPSLTTRDCARVSRHAYC